jgi:hypothetical protein
MTGLSERPSRPPREKRKAAEADNSPRSTYRQERDAILMLYAAKIAAARLFAPKHELDAILAALRAEQRAALSALREREQVKAEARRMKKFAWRFAARGVTRTSSGNDPNRPRSQRRMIKRRDRENG